MRFCFAVAPTTHTSMSMRPVLDHPFFPPLCAPKKNLWSRGELGPSDPSGTESNRTSCWMIPAAWPHAVLNFGHSKRSSERL